MCEQQQPEKRPQIPEPPTCDADIKAKLANIKGNINSFQDWA